jgi:hypothetical protein
MTDKTMTLEQRAREILASEYEACIGEGPYFTYAEMARNGGGDFTMCSVRAVMRALEDSDAITRHLSQHAERGEAVAIGRIDESESGMFVDFYPDRDLPLGAEVYTTPPSAAGVPDGWRLVPIEPTEEMLDAATMHDTTPRDASIDQWNRDTWSFMLDAAPEATPSPTIDVAAVHGFHGFEIVENASVPEGEVWVYDKTKLRAIGDAP